jgi:hypothetical protein
LLLFYHDAYVSFSYHPYYLDVFRQISDLD